MSEFRKKYGPWALVTGASSGIGEAFCRQLAARGMHLILVARRQQRLVQLANELERQHGVQCKVIAGDLASDEFLTELFAATASLEVGLLVNNAGFAQTGNFLARPVEQHLSLLQVNCRAPLMLAHNYGNRMARRGRGGIINVASAAAFLPMPHWGNYAASKAYLLFFSEALGFELQERGVDVLALCPGATRTEFSNVAGTRHGGMEAGEVVACALKSLGKRPLAIAGFTNRLIVLFTRLCSRRLLTKIGAQTLKEMMVTRGFNRPVGST
ncbi:MAG TPA: SDR family oxidoreductase [Gammaproteobacteria bacterium]